MTVNALKIAGVVGDPVSHSLSPKLHGFWLKKYGVSGDYVSFHVTNNELPGFIESLRSDKIEGINLTVPHKEAALALVDRLDDAAQKIGAVNTVYFDEDGKMVGSNTDGYGFLKHLKTSVPGWKSQNSTGVIIGSGGAARAAIVSLLEDGITELRLTNRTLSRAEDLAVELGDERVIVVPWESREQSLINADLVVNVTTLGMTGQPTLDLSLDNLSKTAIVYDIVYNPLETPLLREARKRGNITVDGLGMLLHQAVPGFKAWFGITPEVDQELRDHLLEALQ